MTDTDVIDGELDELQSQIDSLDRTVAKLATAVALHETILREAHPGIYKLLAGGNCRHCGTAMNEGHPKCPKCGKRGTG